jgi:hypothetical protein
MLRLLMASIVIATIFAFSPQRQADDASVDAGRTAASSLAGALADSAPVKLAAEAAMQAALAEGGRARARCLYPAAPAPPAPPPAGRLISPLSSSADAQTRPCSIV